VRNATVRVYDAGMRNAEIRLYAAADEPALRACFIALQDAEHELLPSAPRGRDIVDAYLPWMWRRCAELDGSVFVAVVGVAVVGFVCVLANVPRSDPDDSDASHAFIGEVSVLPSHRGKGVGEALVEHATRHCEERGASNVRLMVLAENSGARRLYQRLGFRDAVVTMIRRL
jgi:ribosomal protein S18 acetylase RimI-like enzyme